MKNSYLQSIMNILKSLPSNSVKILIIVLVVQIGCKPSEKPKESENKGPVIHQENEAAMKDTTPKVTGIGGIFFRSKNPEKTKDWYETNLGLATNDWGSAFEFRNANRPDEINYLSWSPFEEKTDYFNPSEKEFMINYRVQNLEGLLKKLKENGVTILDEVEEYDYGKFVHIMDPEGNKIELWEPIDSVFTAMGGETTK